MERYHIYKLGLAILFYAVYCRRPMVVNGLEVQDSLEEKTNNGSSFDDYFVYYQGVHGVPGADFPVYSSIPRTAFSCKNVQSGYYADLETDCQVFHICNDGRKISFLCPNGTIFQQSDLICEWWFKVNCTNSPNLYEESAEHLREDTLRRKANRRVVDQNNSNNNHGAVMRTEEQHSVSASSQGTRNHEVHGNKQNAERGSQGTRNNQNSDRGKQKSSVYREGSNKASQKSKVYENYDARNNQNQNYNQQQAYSGNQKQSNRQHQKQADQSYSATTQRPVANEKSFSNKPNKASSGGTLSRNDLLNRKLVPNESDETQITQETASFYKNNANNLQQSTGKSNAANQYSNHRETYSDLKNPSYYSKPQFTSTTSVYTTQRINNGQPFVSKTFGAGTTPNYEAAASTIQSFTTISPERKHLAQKYDPGITPTIESAIKFESTPLAPVDEKYSFHLSTTPPPSYGTEHIFNVAGNTQNYVTNSQANVNSETPTTTVSPYSQYTETKSTNQNYYQSTPSAVFGQKLKLNARNNYYTSTPPANVYSTPPQNYYSTGAPVGTTTQNYNDNQYNTGYSYNSVAPTNYQTTTEAFYHSTPPNQYTNTALRNQEYGATSTATTLFNVGETESPSLLANSSLSPADYTTENKKDYTFRLTTSSVDQNSRYTDRNQGPYSTYAPSTGSSVFAAEGYIPVSTNSGNNANENTTPASAVSTAATYFAESTQPPLKFNLALSGYQNNNVQNNKRLSYSAKQSAKNTASYATDTPTTTAIPNKTKYNKFGSTQSFAISTTPATLYTTTLVNSFSNRNRNSYFSPTVVPADSNTFAPTTTSKPESYRTTGASTAEPFTELFNTGKIYQSTANVPTTDSPALLIARNTDRSIPSYANTKQNANDETLVASSSGRPSQNQRSGEKKKLSSSTYNMNKLNFLANGLPSVSTPKIILGIIRNDKAKNSKPNKNTSNKLSGGFYVTKSNDAPQPTQSSYGQKISVPKDSIEPPHFHSKHELSRPKPFSRSTTGSPFEANSVTSTLSPVEATTQFSATTSDAPEYATYSVSSASPFRPATTTSEPLTVASTLPTTYATGKPLSTYENVDNMINALMEIANLNSGDNYEGETPRPGLAIPPSVGPQTLHSLAVYFANALDNIAAAKAQNESATDNPTPTPAVEISKDEVEKAVDALLTHSTVDKYKQLFKENDEPVTSSPVDADNDLETQNSGNAVQTTPRIRQLAQVFTQALSAYLDDPATFKKVLEEVRPTEPPPQDTFTGTEEDEVLNFSDADINGRNRLAFPTVPSLLDASPTWGFLIKFNNASDISGNSISNETNENLQSADSQSFVSQFNKISNDKKTSFVPTTSLPQEVENVKKFNEELQSATPTPAEVKSSSNKSLPSNHWTSSPDATKLWQSTLSVNPSLVNEKLDGNVDTSSTSSLESSETNAPQPTAEISYELKSLPKIELNATQVHGILIDFMNKTEESDKLQRILKKLNTTEEEFLSKMKEIEANPLTRRLILLLISECGVSTSKQLIDSSTVAPVLKLSNPTIQPEESLVSSGSSAAVLSRRETQQSPVKNSSFKQIIHPSLEDDDQDTRALQLLNSLYTIASQFGK